METFKNARGHMLYNVKEQEGWDNQPECEDEGWQEYRDVVGSFSVRTGSIYGVAIGGVELRNGHRLIAVELDGWWYLTPEVSGSAHEIAAIEEITGQTVAVLLARTALILPVIDAVQPTPGVLGAGMMRTILSAAEDGLDLEMVRRECAAEAERGDGLTRAGLAKAMQVVRDFRPDTADGRAFRLACGGAS